MSAPQWGSTERYGGPPLILINWFDQLFWIGVLHVFMQDSNSIAFQDGVGRTPFATPKDQCIPFQIACNLAIMANMTNFRLMQPSNVYAHLPQLTVHYFNFWLCRCLTAARYNINKRTRCGSKGAKKQCHKTPTNSVCGCFLFYVLLNRLH